MRRNRRNNDPNDILGLNDLLDSWMDMMSMAYQLEPATWDKANGFTPIKEKKNNPMSYEDREKDIAFTIDMPGVVKSRTTLLKCLPTLTVETITTQGDLNQR